MRAWFERSVTVDAAIDAVRAEFARNGLTVRLERRGPEQFEVLYCSIWDSSGDLVTDSAGKGGSQQSLASALFEAWEHYWVFYGLATPKPEATRPLPIGDIVAQPALSDETMLHRLAADFPAATVGCLRFESLDEEQEPLWYPVFAKNPTFRRFPIPGDDRSYEPYDRYATGSGSASGMTIADALLHGLLEVIERDAISRALLDWYGGLRPRARRVAADDLPFDLARLLELASAAFGAPPALMDITTDVDIPTYCALPPHDLSPHRNIPGGGSSLSPAYAVERALTELMQLTVINLERKHVEQHRRDIERVRRWPLHRRCTVQDPTIPINAAVLAGKPLSWEWNTTGGDVIQQLAEIKRRLAAHGYRVYWLRWDPDTEVPVVCVLVPGMDTFYLARQGIPVLPTGRAMSMLRDRARITPVAHSTGADHAVAGS